MKSMNKISQLNRSTEQSFTHSHDYTNRTSAHSHPPHSSTIRGHLHPCIHQLGHTDYSQLTHPLLPNMSMHRSTHQLDYTSTIPNSLIHSSRTCSCFHPHINYAIHRLYPTHSSTPPEHVHASIHAPTRLYIDYTQLTHPLVLNMSMHPSTHQLDCT